MSGCCVGVDADADDDVDAITVGSSGRDWSVFLSNVLGSTKQIDMSHFYIHHILNIVLLPSVLRVSANSHTATTRQYKLCLL